MAYTSPKTYASGDVLTAADLNTYQRDNFNAALPNGVSWSSWSPTLAGSVTNPTLGTGSSTEGAYLRIGSLVIAYASVVFGSSGSSAGSGYYSLDLPVAVAGATKITALGSGWLYDSSGTDRYSATAVRIDNSNLRLVFGAGTAGDYVGASTPFAWSTSDQIHVNLQYRVAEPS